MGVFDGIVLQAYKDLLGPSGEKTRLGQIFDDGYHGLGPINDQPAAALDVKNVDLGNVVPNVCAIGSTGRGHALLTLDNQVLHGLDTVAAAPDKKVAPDPNTSATGDAEGWVFPMHFHNSAMIVPNSQTKGDYRVVQGCSDGSTQACTGTMSLTYKAFRADCHGTFSLASNRLTYQTRHVTTVYQPDPTDNNVKTDILTCQPGGWQTFIWNMMINEPSVKERLKQALADYLDSDPVKRLIDSAVNGALESAVP